MKSFRKESTAERLMERSPVLSPELFDFSIPDVGQLSPALIDAFNVIEAAEYDTTNAYQTVITFTGERRTRAGLWLAHELGHGDCMSEIRRLAGLPELERVERRPSMKVRAAGLVSRLSETGHAITGLAVGIEGLINEVANIAVQKRVEAHCQRLGLTEVVRFMRRARGQELMHARGYAEDIEDMCADLTPRQQRMALWMVTRDNAPVGAHSHEDEVLVGHIIEGLFEGVPPIDEITEGVLDLAPNQDIVTGKIVALKAGIEACQQAFRKSHQEVSAAA